VSDFNITLFEACEFLNKSKKSISRYIRRGLLHPEKVKSQQGTLEYRFSKADIEAFKAQEALNAEQAEQTRQDQTEETGQSGQDTPEQTGHGRQDKTGQESEVITLLKETMGLLRDQLKTKDEQISSLGGKIDELIQRDRETNIILKGLQDKVFMLEQPKVEQIGHNPEETGQDKPVKKGFIKKVKDFFKETR
jgi:hypothetical protein